MSSAYLFGYCSICRHPVSMELFLEQVLLASAPWLACAGIDRLLSGHDSTGRRASRAIRTASSHLFLGHQDWQRKTTSAWGVLGLSSRTISSVAGHQGVPSSGGVRRMSPSLPLLPQLFSQPVQLRLLIWRLSRVSSRSSSFSPRAVIYLIWCLELHLFYLRRCRQQNSGSPSPWVQLACSRPFGVWQAGGPDPRLVWASGQ